MAKTNWEIARHLENMYSNSFIHLQKLVMAMEGCQRNQGKKTLFGGDKGEKYFGKFKTHLSSVLHGLVLDGLISTNSSPFECRQITLKAIGEFELAFPNWPDSYVFAQDFFESHSEKAEQIISEIFP